MKWRISCGEIDALRDVGANRFGGDSALAQDGPFGGLDFEDSGGRAFGGVGLQDAVGDVGAHEHAANFDGVCGGLLARWIAAWNGEWDLCDVENRLCDGVIGAADADGSVLDAGIGELSFGGQNEREGAWPVVFGDFAGGAEIDERFSHGQIADHDGEGLVVGASFYRNEVIDSGIVDGVDAYAVDGFGGEYDGLPIE